MKAINLKKLFPQNLGKDYGYGKFEILDFLLINIFKFKYLFTNINVKSQKMKK